MAEKMADCLVVLLVGQWAELMVAMMAVLLVA
jgi:hypothetical protein